MGIPWTLLRHVSAIEWGTRKYMNMKLLEEMGKDAVYPGGMRNDRSQSPPEAKRETILTLHCRKLYRTLQQCKIH